jgi:hypothetical protein
MLRRHIRRRVAARLIGAATVALVAAQGRPDRPR